MLKSGFLPVTQNARFLAGRRAPGASPISIGGLRSLGTGIIAAFEISDKPFRQAQDIIMEAEQLNAIANQLKGLRVRSTELRRYL